MRFPVFQVLTIPAIVFLILLRATTSYAQVESTGFESSDGWDAGFSICGPEFATTCSHPVTDVCVPDDHVANQNCCELDPNESTGWFMDGESPFCREPHIDSVHPSSGLQHLRFGTESGVFGPATAYSSRVFPSPVGKTTLSFDIAGPGSALEFKAFGGDGVVDRVAADLQFDTGRLRVFTSDAGPYVRDSAYRNVTVELDPEKNRSRYCYAGELVRLRSLDSAVLPIRQAAFYGGNSGTWDIDNFDVSRDASPQPPCGFTTAECGPGPCVALKAVAVNNEPVPPRSVVYVRPGDLIDSEILVSGWGLAFSQLWAYRVAPYIEIPASSGVRGSVTPLGTGSRSNIFCWSNSDCPADFPLCANRYGCVNADFQPELGAFIDTARQDFALAELPTSSTITFDLDEYIYAAASDHSDFGTLDSGIPRYAATLRLEVSADACGSFSYEQARGDGLLLSTGVPVAEAYPSHRSLLIHVCQDDGLFCNGVEFCSEAAACTVSSVPNCDDGNDCTTDSCNETTDSCDHVATCGACCDSWIGECRDAVDPIECVCNNCIWTGGADCADVECEAEFVAIPAVSDWGLVILTLTLMVAAKIRFGRAGTDPVPAIK